MAVGGIDDDHVGPGLDQGGHALLRPLAHADRGADAKPPVLVLARVRVLGGLEDVLHRHEAAQLPVAVDHQHALEAVAMHERLGFLEARAFLDGHQLVARRHDVLHRLVEVVLEAQVPVGDDADHALAVEDRKPGDAVLAGDLGDLAHGHVRRDGDGLLDDAALEALDLGHLRALGGGRHVLVHDADAPLLRQRDRQARLGHGIHGGRQQRDVQLDAAGEAGGEADFAGKDVRVGGNEQYVVESERLLDDAHLKPSSQNEIIPIGPYPDNRAGTPRVKAKRSIDVRVDSR